MKHGKKKNGFTLIELLAVIVILAVIALIAVPRIIEILNKAKLSAAEDSTMGIVEAAESYVADFMLKNHGSISSENLEFECGSQGCKLITELKGYDAPNLGKLNYKGKNISSGNIIISNSGKNIQVTNLKINGFNCNYFNNETYCGKIEYNSGDEYELGDYNWHVISDDGKYLTLLMDAGQLERMNHCTDDNLEDTDCGVSNGYFHYSWDKSKIRTYLNGEFLNQLEAKIGTDNLMETEICADSTSITNLYSYGGYLKSEVDSISNATCNNYVKDKVRLITISEYSALSPFYENSLYGLENGGQFARKYNIMRVIDTNWLYGYWWTMNAYSSNDNDFATIARCIESNGCINNFSSRDLNGVRPVITISKSDLLQ